MDNALWAKMHRIRLFQMHIFCRAELACGGQSGTLFFTVDSPGHEICSVAFTVSPMS